MNNSRKLLTTHVILLSLKLGNKRTVYQMYLIKLTYYH